jgi:hypothetical protein
MRTFALSSVLLMMSIFVGSQLPAAPVPKAQVIRATQMSDLIGKSHLSLEMQAFRKTLDSDPVAKYFVEEGGGVIDSRFHHKWHEQGFMLVFNKTGVMEGYAIYLVPKDKFKSFTGELPQGLKAGDKPSEIRKKLGDPDESESEDHVCPPKGEAQKIGAWWGYPKLHLHIGFTHCSIDDPEVQIEFVEIVVDDK